MNKLLKTDENIKTIALAFLDEEDGYLKQVQVDNLYISVPNKEFKHMQFFLIGDEIYTNKLTVTVRIDNPSYRVGVTLGEKYKNLSQFDKRTAYLNYHSNAEFKYANAIPVDIVVFSDSVVEETSELEIFIESREWGEE